MLSVLLALLTAPAIVTVSSFAHPSAKTIIIIPCVTQPSPPNGRAPSALHAARRRGGAMARRSRKKPSHRSGDGGGPADGGGPDSRGFGHEESATSKADDIYSMPPLYDLAFGYRSYGDEVTFLLGAHYRHAERPSTDGPLRVLELAAGPARHSLAALSGRPPSEVGSATALDRSGAMAEYGLENANRELGAPGGRRDDFAYAVGDIRSVGDYAPGAFDAAWLLLGSMQHLLTNEDVTACLSSVRSVLEPGGTVVIELPHPKETFSMGECTRNGWTVPLVEDGMVGGEENEYGELNVVWGEEDDEFDPVAQVRQFTVELGLTVNNIDGVPTNVETSPLFLRMTEEGKFRVREIVPMRLFTLQEIDALARCAGFDMVAKYGALDEEVSIDDEEEAFRMVCVLRKL